MAKWRGRVRPLTKKFINEFSEQEIEYLENFVKRDDGCSLCIFTNQLTIKIPRFEQSCKEPSLCETILGIRRKRTLYGCGCNELGKEDAFEHLRRITKKWRQLNGGVK